MTELIFLDDIYVEPIKIDGSDDLVIDAARVSTKKTFGSGAQKERDDYVNSRNEATGWTAPADQVLNWQGEAISKDKGLINMLMRDRHGSPFEHVGLTVYVKAPIFVFREWHRHRIASYNEMSGRYTKLNPEFYVPAADRPLVQVGKPGAYTFEPGTEEMLKLTHDEIKSVAESAWASYERMLETGIAKEVARAVLPVTTYSQMYCTMNLRALMNFLALRTKTKENSRVPSFPQHEISLGADKLEAVFAENFPWVHEAFENNGRVAP